MPNDNVQNLQQQQAIAKIRDITDDTNIAMLCTNLGEAPFSACPMSAQRVEDNGDLVFLSARDSEHNRDIQRDNRVQLLFANPGKSAFLSLYGKAEISQDRSEIDRYWNPLANTWFDGKDDPNLTLLRIRPEEGYFWDTKTGKLMALVKMGIGAITGKTMDDGIQGHISI